MKVNKYMMCCILVLALMTRVGTAFAQSAYYLIAHRGGVVDSATAENSVQAQKKAFEQGYKMIEVDVRLTKDSVLITHHDATFKRSFGLDSAVSSMTWKQISGLENKIGYKVQKLEDVLEFCRGKLEVMIDMKIRGNNPVAFNKLIVLLKKYNLYANALMIGTEEATPFFIGKIKQSCTRQQIEQYMQKPDFDPSDYFLFSGRISKDDVAWAKQHKIPTIGVVNAWSIKSAEVMEKAKAQASALKEAGVTSFQIDSPFLEFFK
jgi:glycerophosphoryl diester phosphodiesterase